MKAKEINFALKRRKDVQKVSFFIAKTGFTSAQSRESKTVSARLFLFCEYLIRLYVIHFIKHPKKCKETYITGINKLMKNLFFNYTVN